LPSGDPLLEKEKVTQAQLKDRKLWVMPEGHCFRSQVLSYCGSGAGPGRQPVHFESGSFDTLIRLVDDGLGATVLPDLVTQRLPAKVRRARVRPLVSPVPVREIGLVVSRADLRRRVTSVLSQVIRESLEPALGVVSARAQVMDPMSAA